MQVTDITVTRTIPAPPEDVFDVWMDSKSPGGPWFGAARVILNHVVDGLFYIAAEHEGRIWRHYGRFLRIDRPRCMEFTWVSEATQGVESLVAFMFEARGGETEVGGHAAPLGCAGGCHGTSTPGWLVLGILASNTLDAASQVAVPYLQWRRTNDPMRVVEEAAPLWR
jgi:hypothetical protein